MQSRFVLVGITMPTNTRYLLHTLGPALWPQHKPLAEILQLKATTIADVWETTYQANPQAAGGATFKREWWNNNRFDAGDMGKVRTCVARWHSWDTALSDEDGNAFSALVVGELWPDYRLTIREVYKERLDFPGLLDAMTRFARRDNVDKKLRAVIIEDKASGTSAVQTLQGSSEMWLSSLIVPFMPSGDKERRAKQASVWCSNGSVMLPHPSDYAPWLSDFENELFSFPGSTFKDQVDAFDQLVIYTENLLAEGLRARQEALMEGVR